MRSAKKVLLVCAAWGIAVGATSAGDPHAGQLGQLVRDRARQEQAHRDGLEARRLQGVGRWPAAADRLLLQGSNSADYTGPAAGHFWQRTIHAPVDSRRRRAFYRTRAA